MTATIDVKFFHLYEKIPSTCYGPVGENIHGVDEWVSIERMQRVAAVYALFIARWCGLNRLAVGVIPKLTPEVMARIDEIAVPLAS